MASRKTKPQRDKDTGPGSTQNHFLSIFPGGFLNSHSALSMIIRSRAPFHETCTLRTGQRPRPLSSQEFHEDLDMLISIEVETDTTALRPGELVRPGPSGRTQKQLSRMGLGNPSVPWPGARGDLHPCRAALTGSRALAGNDGNREAFAQAVCLRSAGWLGSVPRNFAAFLELSAMVLLWSFLSMNCSVFELCELPTGPPCPASTSPLKKSRKGALQPRGWWVGGGGGPSGKRRPQSSSTSSPSDSSPPRLSYSLSLCRSWISFISSAYRQKAPPNLPQALKGTVIALR